MLPSARPARRAVSGAIGVGALAGAMLFGVVATAAAQPPEPALPPPCTAAELARVMSGVTFDTSNDLTTTPTSTISSPVSKASPGIRSRLRYRLI